jgi:hypothetical protein
VRPFRLRLDLGTGALVLALGACSGPAEISLGGAGMVSTKAAFLSPRGDDQNPGSREFPWKTFRAALKRMGPGSTLTLLEGTYDGGATGYLNARCVAGPGGPANATAGTDDTDAGRVLITADPPGGAFLRGDDSGPPLSIDGCSNWMLEGLHVESDDLNTAPTTPEAGSVVVIGENTQQLVLRHLVLGHPNGYRHSHVLHIGDRSRDIRVEECELYDFHENAVETARTSDLTFRRNYLNSRGREDKTDGVQTAFPTSGDFGFFFEETSRVLAENNIVENVHDGFGLVGRDNAMDGATPPANPPEGNRFLGNIVRQAADVGVRIDSRCNKQSPCEPSRTIRGTKLVDNAVLGGAAGLSSAGAVDTTVQRFTSAGTANGVLFIKEPQNGPLMSSMMTTNSLAIVQDVGFRSDNETSWSFDHCAVMTSVPAAAYIYVPPDASHVSGQLAVPSDLGACQVFIPEASALKHAGLGTAVGADIINRYENGVLTATRLWSVDGSFPCGPVTSLNSNPATSCAEIHKRLRITPAGAAPSPSSCPLP